MTNLPPWQELNTEPREPLPDRGDEYLGAIRTHLMIDEEWATRTNRQISWWGGPIPMKISVSEPRAAFGDPMVKLTAAVRMVRSVSANLEDAALLVGSANAMTAGFSLWVDPFEKDVWMSTTFYLHDGNRSVFEAKLPAVHILLAYGAAIAKAPHLVEALGGDLANDPHPISGVRQDWDELTDIAATLVEPQGRAPSRWGPGDFEIVQRWFEQQGMLSLDGPNSVTAEFPFTSFTPAMEQIALGITDGGSTSLYRMAKDEPHPALGSGLFCLLQTPTAMPPEEAALLCNGLNWAEANELTGFPSWGSWTLMPNDSNGSSFEIDHVLFHPNMLFRPGISQTLAFYAFLRGAWVQDRLVDEAWLRAARGGRR